MQFCGIQMMMLLTNSMMMFLEIEDTDSDDIMKMLQCSQTPSSVEDSDISEPHLATSRWLCESGLVMDAFMPHLSTFDLLGVRIKAGNL